MKNPVEALEYAVQFKGDIAEIGAGVGNTTYNLAKIARESNRQVLVVDPFEKGWKEMPSRYGEPYPKGKFITNVKKYIDCINLHEESSLCESSEKFLSVPLCFAFIDGLQFKGAILSDLRIVSHAKVICVDDMNRITGQSQTPSAVKEFIKLTNKTLTVYDRWAFIT